MKICSNEKCKQTNPQPYSAFYKTTSNLDGCFGRCKYCVKTENTKRYKKNTNKLRNRASTWKSDNPDKVKDRALRDKYGISYQQYCELLTAQSDSCAVCKKHKSENIKDVRTNKVRSLAVDHNHATNQNRGLLCYGCNLAIGMLKDNIEYAKSLVEYLRFYEEKSKI